ncbi:MAG: response regulator transcription factor [Dehalococcoidia bacterium]
MRQGLRMLLGSRTDVAVVADVRNGREAVLAAEQHRADVVLMDIVMPGLNGLEATRQVRKRSPRTRVIVLSAFVDDEQITAALQAGASGYLKKSADADELLCAIQAVASGEEYFSGELTRMFDIAELALQARRHGSPRTGVAALTEREREVLQVVAEGHTNQQIARELTISVKTVEAHLAHIMAKLHARNRADLIRHAIRAGVVRLESADEAAQSLSERGAG